MKTNRKCVNARHDPLLKGTIFDIKRYAIHDGPGIRTTIFFKGCSLRCPWCHNPEGLEAEPEFIIRSERCVQECQACVAACEPKAISKNGTRPDIDKEKCDLCRECEEACVYEALEIVGREITVQELIDEIEKDRIFFEESGGGVTFSGGEPLEQPEFLVALLEEARVRKLHVALDISGYTSSRVLERISDRVDLFLYDLKIMDEKKHEEYTGVSNKIILENLRMLSEKGKQIEVRIPLVSGVNDDDQNMKLMADYLFSLRNRIQVSLLPFHRGGSEKYKRLGKDRFPRTFQPPSDKRLDRIRGLLAGSDFAVKVGG